MKYDKNTELIQAHKHVDFLLIVYYGSIFILFIVGILSIILLNFTVLLFVIAMIVPLMIFSKYIDNFMRYRSILADDEMIRYENWKKFDKFNKEKYGENYKEMLDKHNL